MCVCVCVCIEGRTDQRNARIEEQQVPQHNPVFRLSIPQ